MSMEFLLKEPLLTQIMISFNQTTLLGVLNWTICPSDRHGCMSAGDRPDKYSDRDNSNYSIIMVKELR